MMNLFPPHTLVKKKKKNVLNVRTTERAARESECNTTETLHIIADAPEPQPQVRGRPKYPSYSNFKGRKSSSMMNLCGKEHQQCLGHKHTF